MVGSCAGELKGADVPNFGGPWFCTVLRRGIINISITRAAIQADDPLSVTRAECELREQVFRFAQLLRDKLLKQGAIL